jgi:hypothetical protein
MPLQDFDPNAYRDYLHQQLGLGPQPGSGPDVLDETSFPDNYMNPGEGPDVGGPDDPEYADAQRNLATSDTGGGGGKNLSGSAVPGQVPTAGPQQAPDKKIPIGPPGFDHAADPKKIEKANTIGDLMDAVTPKKRSEYMDWWEQQYGSINQKFDSLSQELGHRPDKNKAMSREDKFRMLMEFGINMIRNSDPRSGTGTTGGNLALSGAQAIQQQEGERAQEAAQYDAKSAQIEQQRQVATKNLGTRGQAMQAEASIISSGAKAKAEESRQRYYDDKTGKEPQDKVTGKIIGEDGQYYYTTMSGKTIRAQENGKDVKADMKARRAVGGRQSVFSEKLAEWKDAHPLSSESSEQDKQSWNDEALAYASGKTGLTKDQAFIKALSQSRTELGNPAYYDSSDHDGREYEDEVQARALEIMEKLHQLSPTGHYPGRNAAPVALPGGNLSSAGPTQLQTGNVPPASALQPGKVTTFKNGTRWTLDASGKPKRVLGNGGQ